MKIRILLSFVLLSSSAAAEEGVFLSLTRSAEPAAELPTQRSVVTREELVRAGARHLGEALDLVPGVVFVKNGTLGNMTTLKLRGATTSNQVQILIDDQPVGGVAVQNVDLSQIPVDDIERIEVVRGGSSVLYGANAMGGVVNVITRRHPGGVPQTTLRAEGGSYFTQVYHGQITAGSGRASGAVSVGKQTTDGFQRNSDSDGMNVTARGEATVGEKARVFGAVSRVDNETGVPNGTPVSLGEWDGVREREPNDPTGRVAQKTTRARAGASLPLGEWAVLSPSIHHGVLSYRSYNTAFPSDRQERITGGDLRLRTVSGSTLGVSYERDERQADGETDSHVTDWGAYAQQEWRWGRLSMNPALRMDAHGTFGHTYNPRLGLVYRLTEGWKLSATAARSFRAPTFLDLYYPGYSNPQLNPETAWTYDGGLEFQTENFSFRATGFFHKIRDRIALNPSFIPENQPRAEISGAEWEMFYRAGPLHTRTSYAYTRAIGTAYGSDVHQGLRLTPRHTAAQEILLDLPRRWSLRNGLRYVHSQYSNDGDQGSKLPSFTLWNMGLAKKILASEFYVSVDNLTNKHYAESIAFGQLFPQPGRTVRAGVSIRFAN